MNVIMNTIIIPTTAVILKARRRIRRSRCESPLGLVAISNRKPRCFPPCFAQPALERKRRAQHDVLKTILFQVFLFAIVLAVVPVYAAFEDIGWSARTQGFGNAFSALADEGSIMYYNPAGLSVVPWKQLSGGTGLPLVGLSDGSIISRSFASYVHPLRDIGTLGIGWSTLNCASAYQENIFLASWGRLTTKNLGIGLGLRGYLNSYQKFPAGDPLLEKIKSAQGFGFDTGLYWFGAPYCFAASVLNVNQPNIGLGTNQYMPLTVKAGAAYRGLITNFAVDFTYKKSDFIFTAGAEEWFKRKTIAARIGVGMGTRDFKQISCGFSYFGRARQFDYAWVYPVSGMRAGGGSHYLGVTMHIGAPPKESYLPAGFSPEEMALEESEKAERERISRLENYISEARSALENGDYRSALHTYTMAYELAPGDPTIKAMWTKLGKIVTVYPEVAGSTKKDRLIRLGVDNYLTGNGRTSLNAARYASELYGDRPINELLMVLQEEYPDLAQGYEKTGGMNLVEQKLFRALNSIYEGSYDRAIAECNDVLALEPDNGTALMRLGSAYYLLGDDVRAREVWERALDLNPENKELIKYLKSVGGRTTPRKPQPEHEPEKPKSVQPALPGIPATGETVTPVTDAEKLQLKKTFFNQGMELYNDMKYKEAIDSFQKVLVLDPDHTASRTRVRMAREKLALPESERIAAYKKECWARGTDYYNQGKWAESAKEFRRILRVDPNHAPSKRLLSECESNLGK